MTLQIINNNFQSLFVKKVSQKEELDELRRVAYIWCQVADQKKDFCENEEEIEQFSDCSLVSRMVINISIMLDSYICTDYRGDIQGMMCLSAGESDIHLVALASSPFHIRATPNNNIERKIRGAGTLLLKTAEEIAFREGKNTITLCATLLAKPFYQKCGYREIDEQNMIKTISSFGSISRLAG